MSNKIPLQLQNYLKRLDELQNTYAVVVTQKQNVETQLIEVNNAISELEKAREETDIYKMAGSILVKTQKEDISKDLNESKMLLETRLKTLEKQEKRLTDEIGKLNTNIQQMLQKERIGTG